jgi:hypothetical protein
MKLFSSRAVYLLIVSFALVGVTSVPVQAQASNRQSKQKNKGPLPLSPMQQRGLETLDGLALEARQIDSPAVRADLQALIGDALWDFDKPNAKNIFVDAFKNARNLEDPNDAMEVQTAILRHVWSRDRALAEELIKQLSSGQTQKTAEATESARLSSQFGMQSSDPAAQQKLDLAKNLLEDDAAAAASLIRDSLQREVTFVAINQLGRLKAKDPETANRIFERAVNQLQYLPSSSAIMAAIAMADYVSPSCSLCPQKAYDPTVVEAYYTSALRILRRSLGETPPPLPLNRDLQEKVVQYFHEMQAILALTLSRFARPTELGELQTIYRDKVLSLTLQKQKTVQSMEQSQNAPDRFELLFRKAESIDNAEQRDLALSSTVQLALRQELTDEVLAKLSEKIERIESKKLHDKAWSLLKIREVDKLIKSGEFDRAYTLSLNLPDLITRATALRALSTGVARKGSQTLRSSNLLADALESLQKSDASIERSQILFKVASDFVNLKDFDHAFDALQFTSGSLAQLTRSDFEQAGRDIVPNSLFDYGGTFGRLGKVDFDKSLFVAQGIKWREFRLAAQIATCRSVLSRGK